MKQEMKRKMKKEMANDNVSLWKMDLQGVLLVPKTKASTMYYKTKLQLHTLFNLQNKQGYCYVWEEHEGSLSSGLCLSPVPTF
jgi:hypothetical protein